MRSHSFHSITLRIGIILFGMIPLYAQNSSVQGYVSDTSGAVIAGSTVILRQLDTETSLKTQTNEAGLYSFPSLPNGRILVRVEHPGFRIAESKETILTVGQAARIDVQLSPGEVTETITVEAAAPPLDTESTMVGQVINNRTVVNLPLNGRNYLELARLTAGVAPAVGARPGTEGAFSASGQHSWQLNVQLDGVDNNSRESGGQLGYEAQAVKPSVDSVGEFRVVTNNLSAEYGFRMGGTVLVSMKSGTNAIHGSAFEFLRNDKLDATNFFANRNGSAKPVFKRNQFGGTIGGPLIHDRTFYFGSYEGTRIRNGLSSVSTVPTLEMRDGNFSRIRPIFDPATTTGTGASMTRSPFPGNVIPKSRWDPLAANLVALYPAPTDNSKIANNYFYSPVDKYSNDSYDSKIDHTLSDRFRLSGRYSYRNSSDLQPGPLPMPADGGLWTTSIVKSHNLAASLISTLTPSLASELRFGYSKVHTNLDIPYDEALFDQFGIKGIPTTSDPNSNNHGLTRFSPAGYAELGSRSFWPNLNDLDYWQISDIVFKSAGNHTLRAGFDIRREQMLRIAARYARGNYVFGREFTADPKNRANTGDGLAEMLLGMASGGTLGNENLEDIKNYSFDGFVQDDWRITRKLTLNLGVRYDVFLAATFDRLSVSNYVLDYSNTGPTARLKETRPTDTGDCGCNQDLNNFAPRVGFAWQATPKTVIRSGFGIIYGQADSLRKHASRFSNQAPDFTEYNFATLDRINPQLTLSGGFPAIQLPATSVPGPNLVGISARTPDLPTQYSQQWFADIQRELPFGLVTTLGYTGNGTRHLVGGFNYSLPPDGPSPVPVAQRRLWPYYTGVSGYLAFGNLSYNAFTWRLEKRFSAGVQFLSAYTWSHTIDNVLEDNNESPGQGSLNPFNRQLDRGNAVTDIRHNYVVSGVWEIPFGRGRKWLQNGRFIDLLAGGWQLGGIFSARTGAPFTVTTTGGITNAGGADRPNRLADGALPSSERSIDRWFDLSAFRVQEQYTYGNSGRNILFGPGLRNIDLSLAKAFILTEQIKLQFRAEAFNATNTPAFGLPNAVLNGAGAGTITTAGDPRRIQFGLKLLW